MQCGRLFVTENFYIKQTLRKKFLAMKDGEIMLFPVRLNAVEDINRPSLKMGIYILQHSERGAWILVQTLQKTQGS